MWFLLLLKIKIVDLVVLSEILFLSAMPWVMLVKNSCLTKSDAVDVALMS